MFFGGSYVHNAWTVTVQYWRTSNERNFMVSQSRQSFSDIKAVILHLIWYLIHRH